MSEKIFGLIGRRLGHSYSPQIHRELGNPDYALYELEPEALEGFLRGSQLCGVNVTIPYKKTVLPLCDELSPLARDIGSVNTVVRRADGSLFGHNTDAGGFAYMAKRAGISLAGKKVVILGSGGASVTVQQVAKNAGARQVIVAGRSLEVNFENLAERHSDAEIIVNATPVGMYPGNGESLVKLDSFPRCEGVLDLVYNPHRTALILAAQERGIACCDGLPMLVEQAREAAELFLGAAIAQEESERILRIIRCQTENIVLIGMPGCGKSSIGAALAELCGRPAIDLDGEIVRAAGCSIPEIFERGGEEEFRRMEREQVSLAGKRSGCIILTGGGVVKDVRNYAPLHQNGRIYHITRDIDALAREGRPLSQGADLAAMYAERLPMYQRFCDAIIENDSTVADAAAKIWRDFNENTGD